MEVMGNLLETVVLVEVLEVELVVQMVVKVVVVD